jgi:hypothetical protein
MVGLIDVIAPHRSWKSNEHWPHSRGDRPDMIVLVEIEILDVRLMPPM